MSEFLPAQQSVPNTLYKETFQSNSKNRETASHSSAVEDALDQIDRILHQMLLLAELSASNANVDRELLQGVLERMKAQINQIADGIEKLQTAPE